MSYNNNGQRDMAQQYLRQQIEQASSIEQVLMLYDGAMRFLLQAKAAIERNDIQARCNANRRAMEIMAYLIDMVNPETGGEAGKRLFGIYSSLLKRMLQIDFDNSTVVCDEIVGHVRTLRVSMAQAVSAQQAVRPGLPQANVVAAPSSAEPAPHGVKRDAVA